MFSIPALGKTLYKNIRREFAEKRYCWQTRMNEQDKYGIELNRHAGGEQWKETQPVCFHPKDWNVCLKVECS